MPTRRRQGRRPSIQYRTVSTGDFNNVLLAKRATATLVSQGADVLFLMLDNGFAGAQQAVPGVRQGRQPGEITMPKGV